MAASLTQKVSVLERLQLAWAQTDRIFSALSDEAWEQQPVPLRHPFIFYLGHLPAFAWNQIAGEVLGISSDHAEFDRLFERGIDPPSEAEAGQRGVQAWPSLAETRAYRDRIRERIPALLDAVLDLDEGHPMAAAAAIYHVVLEHELMHHETLLYMLQQLDPGLTRPTAGLLPDAACLLSRPAPEPEVLEIPAGVARLGADPSEAGFHWDNELPGHTVPVDAFDMDRYPVTNARFLTFVDGGGYSNPEHWIRTGGQPAAFEERGQPLGWLGEGAERRCRTLLGDVPWDLAKSWPVMVSAVEAEAFAHWEGRRLPTEAEWHRAAYGCPANGPRRWPWGDAPPEARRGNFAFRHWAPTPVDAHPEGASAFGIEDLLGNAWEWTATHFEPFPGFEVSMPNYPGYSADFFGKHHRVILGGSWSTALPLLRASFRNWFRTDYPYAFTGFRLAGAPRSGA